MTYKTLRQNKRKKLLKEYELLFYDRTINSISVDKFDEEKYRIQVSMIEFEIPVEAKRQARELGTNRANKCKIQI